ncbi:RagB/SusD family nutrient uptake outer membrane protein [Sphingobacterium athyrii]|uniref:RagB/SusD family nutrient uptake outer membrane protein n=1 Tax=Sphingobacterium athyrii TaxID=2152717 RepID=A0A363NM64_9SPHI|nr:RagB/SusD family nutrient uptake outer membrane protein [Sphingobacterium athyrii]PUV21731.1 RagB/SusD family nutrient uptake outer membrane protein [Sphingobacterium athyrii]
MKNFKNILGIILLGTVVQSCNIDKFPQDKIELSQSFQTVEDAKNWDNATFSFFRSRSYGIYSQVTDVQADQLNAVQDFGNVYGDEHRWTNFLSDNYSIRDIYRNYYSGINNLNTAIKGYSTIVPKNDAEKTLLNQYIGDAHFARAYYYLNLTLRFAKAYNASSAESDLAVPLVLVPDLEAKPARATVDAVYKQILSDIAIAKTNLMSQKGKLAATRFTIDAVIALEARVKLYMSDWGGAANAAVQLIKEGKYPLTTTQEAFRKLWIDDSGDEVIFQPVVSRPNELPNTISTTYGYSAANKDYRPGFMPSLWVINSFSNADFRKSVYFKEVTVGGQSLDKPQKGIVVNKFAGSLVTGLNIDLTTNYVTPKVFRIAEMYLVAAESYFKAGNEFEALKYLNELRIARGLTAVSSSGNSLFKDIKDERTKELIFEGFRLDDLKRWGEGFQRRDPQLPFARTGAEYADKKVEANNLKFVWGLPANDVTINPNIVQNPGW